MDGSGWARAPMWGEWGRLTRLLWSARIAFQTEIDRIGSSAEDPVAVVRLTDAGGSYEASAADHVALLRDPREFYALVLGRSVALMESHCRLVKHVVDTGRWSILVDGPADADVIAAEAIDLPGGIEAWSTALMRDVGQDWESVYGKLAGIVEVSIVRNALAHGALMVSADHVGSATRRGTTLPFAIGASFSIGFELVHEYRGRIRSLCRSLGDGVVHLARGTHRKFKESQ